MTSEKPALSDCAWGEWGEMTSEAIIAAAVSSAPSATFPLILTFSLPERLEIRC